MHVTRSMMLFALVASASSRPAGAFAFRSRGAVSRSSQTKQLSMSFFDELTLNIQKAFSTAAGTPAKSSSKFYTVAITGSSGLLGTALIDELRTQGSLNGKPLRIVKLTRSDSVDQVQEFGEATIVTVPWNPMGAVPEAVVNPTALSSIDAVVHLAGENVATGLGPLGFLGLRPWTAEKKAEIINSRVIPTQALAKAIAACDTPTTLLAASGVGVYGNDFIGQTSSTVDEETDTSDAGGFLAEVSRKWEAATNEAGRNRVVNMRMGVVLSKLGGALGKLYPIFFLGGGGIVGSGNQFFTFISARDAASALVHTLSTPSLTGPVNVCSPNPCTNAEFTAAFGKVLSRPTILPLPSFAVSALFGEMGEEMLLGGVRAVPGKLVKSGFEFKYPTIEQALQSAVDENI